MNVDKQPVVLRHLGIIVDGNRRWASKRGLPAALGHNQGLNRIEEIVREAFNKGVGFVSLFVFSTDNWNRSVKEVKHLMQLFLKYFKKDSQRLIKEGICFKIAGQISEPLSAEVIKAAQQLEADSKHNQGGSTVILCFNYGGRTELVDMAKSIVDNKISSSEINVDTVRQHLYHPDVPDLDLVIRTSGEQRISGFQLWRANYAELLFVDKFWPDFTKEDLNQAIEAYTLRHRRFGGD